MSLYSHGRLLLAGGEVIAPFEADTTYHLSQFAYIHRSKSNIILQIPNNRVVVHEAAILVLVYELPDLKQSYHLLSAELCTACIRYLAERGILVNADEKSYWTFHDWLFFRETRQGSYHTAPAHPAPKIAPVKAPMSDDITPLSRAEDTLPLRLEARCSTRNFAAEPLPFEQLSAFLWHSARVKQSLAGRDYDATQRPYPGAGALYELEIYTLCNHCEKIASGLYHYHPVGHHLERLNATEGHLTALQQDAANHLPSNRPPHVLLFVTARFGRIQWKYPHTALSLILKNVGGLFQTWYMVAAGLGLGACAIGGGNAALFADTVGLRLHKESSIGEFALGVPLHE